MPLTTDLRDDVASAFESLVGRTPDGLWSAPGVVPLAGGRLVAVNRRTVVALGARDDSTLRIASLPDDELAELPLADVATVDAVGWLATALDAVRALGADLGAVPGIDLVLDSTVPDVLGADAALAAAITVALADVWRVETAVPDSGAPAPETLLVVDTDDADLAIETLIEVGASHVHAFAGGVSAVIDPDSVSRAQVSIDGAFAEHGLGQPEMLVVESSAGALRER